MNMAVSELYHLLVIIIWISVTMETNNIPQLKP